MLLILAYFRPIIIVLIFRDGQCPEYTCQDQVICAIGLVRSKPGVFIEAIQYLLVLATPLEVGSCYVYSQMRKIN